MQTLFDLRLPAVVMIPDWHRAEREVLIAQIVAPLALLRPDLDEAARLLRAKAIYAAVHLAVQGRFVGASRDRLKPEVEALVATLVRGAGAAP